MNTRWIVAFALVLAVGGAFALGGATVLAGQNLLQTRIGDSPLVAGVLQSIEKQESDSAESDRGIVVVSVIADSPAAAAGVQRGDILIAIDESETNGLADVRAALADIAEGDSATLHITRGGEARTLTATLNADDGLLGIEACDAGGMAGGLSLRGEMGARITEVVAGSPAAKAGLAVGEVITAVDGESLAHPMALGEVIAARAVGDSVTLTVQDGEGSEREVTVTLGATPDGSAKPYLGVRYAPAMGIGRGEAHLGIPPMHGFPDAPLPPLADGESFSALVIAEVESGSAAEAAGLQRGDYITEIDGTPVAEMIESGDDVSTILANYQPGNRVTLTVRRGADEPLTLEATLEEGENGGAVLGIQAGMIHIMSSDGAPFEGMPEWDSMMPDFDTLIPVPENSGIQA